MSESNLEEEQKTEIISEKVDDIVQPDDEEEATKRETRRKERLQALENDMNGWTEGDYDYGDSSTGAASSNSLNNTIRNSLTPSQAIGPLPLSIDIRKLFGNIHLLKNPVSKKGAKNIQIYTEDLVILDEAFSTAESDSEFLNLWLKKARKSHNNVRNYFNVFKTKATIVLEILNNLISAYFEQIEKIKSTYKEIAKEIGFWSENLNSSTGDGFKICNVPSDFPKDSQEPKADPPSEAQSSDSPQSSLKKTRERSVKYLQNLISLITFARQSYQEICSNIEAYRKSAEEKMDWGAKKAHFFQGINRVKENKDKYDRAFQRAHSLVGGLADSLAEGKGLESSAQKREEFMAFCIEDQNLSALEAKLLSSIQSFRNNLDRGVIEKIFAVHVELGMMVKKNFDHLKKTVLRYEELCQKIFKDWEFEGDIETHPLIRIANIQIDFISALKPQFHSFIKKKLRLPASSSLTELDLADFFQFYDFKFTRTSSNLLLFLPVGRKEGEGESAVKIDTLLQVDIQGTLTVQGLPGTDSPQGIQLMVPLSRVVLKFDSKAIQVQMNVIDGQGEVIAERGYFLNDLSTAVTFLKTFYTLQKVFKTHLF